MVASAGRRFVAALAQPSALAVLPRGARGSAAIATAGSCTSSTSLGRCSRRGVAFATEPANASRAAAAAPAFAPSSSSSSRAPASAATCTSPTSGIVELFSVNALGAKARFEHDEDELPPVLCLHGLLGSSRNLQAWAAALAKRFDGKRRVLMVDLRNHGQSGHSDVMSYPAMAEDVIALLDRNSIRCASLLGHSMGGKVAAAAALLHPHRVESVTLLDIAPVRYGGQSSSSTETGQRVWGTMSADLLEVLIDLPLERFSSRKEIDAYITMTKAAFPQWFRTFALTNLERKNGKWSWRVNLTAIMENWHGLAGFDTSGHVHGGRSQMTSFAGPALLVRGSKSRYILSEHTEAVRHLLPQHSVVTLEGAGHFLHTEDPAGLLDVVHSFLMDTESGL